MKMVKDNDLEKNVNYKSCPIAKISWAILCPVEVHCNLQNQQFIFKQYCIYMPTFVLHCTTLQHYATLLHNTTLYIYSQVQCDILQISSGTSLHHHSSRAVLHQGHPLDAGTMASDLGQLPVTADNIQEAIRLMYGQANPNPEATQAASRWLTAAKASPQAWDFLWMLLTPDKVSRVDMVTGRARPAYWETVATHIRLKAFVC